MKIYPIIRTASNNYEASYVLEGAGIIHERFSASSEFQVRQLIRAKYRGQKINIMEVKILRGKLL